MCQLFSCSQERRSARQKTDGIATACAPVGAFSRWGVGSFFVLLQPSCAAALGCLGLHQPACLIRCCSEKTAAEPVRKNKWIYIQGFLPVWDVLVDFSFLVRRDYREMANKNLVTVRDLKGKLTQLLCTGEPQTAQCHTHWPPAKLSAFLHCWDASPTSTKAQLWQVSQSYLSRKHCPHYNPFCCLWEFKKKDHFKHQAATFDPRFLRVEQDTTEGKTWKR